MVWYEVTVETAPELAERFEAYMRDRHIPQILATGCFTEIRFQRAAGGRFRTAYGAADHAAVERYLAEHTAGFRVDFAEHFPDGATAAREVWTDVEVWAR